MKKLILILCFFSTIFGDNKAGSPTLELLDTLSPILKDSSISKFSIYELPDGSNMYRKYETRFFADGRIIIRQTIDRLIPFGPMHENPRLIAIGYKFEAKKLDKIWQINSVSHDGTLTEFGYQTTITNDCCNASPLSSLYNKETGELITEYDRIELYRKGASSFGFGLLSSSSRNIYKPDEKSFLLISRFLEET